MKPSALLRASLSCTGVRLRSVPSRLTIRRRERVEGELLLLLVCCPLGWRALEATVAVLVIMGVRLGMPVLFLLERLATVAQEGADAAGGGGGAGNLYLHLSLLDDAAHSMTTMTGRWGQLEEVKCGRTIWATKPIDSATLGLGSRVALLGLERL